MCKMVKKGMCTVLAAIFMLSFAPTLSAAENEDCEQTSIISPFKILNPDRDGDG